MRIKPTPSSMLFAVLCVYLTSGEPWLREALAVQNSRIVFTSARDGNLEIYVMDADGSNQENLTNSPANDSQPDWSPDGTKIAFVSFRDGGRTQIHVMDADGKNAIRLTDGVGEKWDPDWSPDGQQIAFSVDVLVNRIRVHHIAVMDADGRNRQKLEDQARHPSWSPDGGEIAFMSWRDGGEEIYVIGVGGQGRKRVTQDIVHKLDPSFSPDGRRIAFAAVPEHEGFGHIYVVGADGRNRVQLTHNEEHHWGPAWSPDGRMIAYYVWDDFSGLGTIHLIASDGRYIRRLSDGRNARDYQPDISPLGLAVSPDSVTTTTWGRLKQVEPNRR